MVGSSSASGATPHGVLVVDKPAGPTSHDVVARVRRALGTRAVGHAGTLDPAATGVLVVAVGEATKLVAYLTAEDKAYRARILLGAQTDTLDAEGTVTERTPVPEGLDRPRVEAAAQRFIGVIEQRAPLVSAIKQGGRPLHERVRRGEVVEAPVRQVVVRAIDVLEVGPDTIELAVRCGKGFYVRALARDLAHALGTSGHLCALRRTESGRFALEGATPWKMVEAAARGDAEARATLASTLLSLEEAVASMPQVTLTEAGREDAFHGRPIGPVGVAAELPEGPETAVLALHDREGQLVALGRRDGDRVRVVRGFRR